MEKGKQTIQETVHNKITRLYLLDLVRRFKASDMYKVIKESVIIYEGEDGQDQYDKNWEWLLFTATLKQLNDLCEAFVPLKQVEEAKKPSLLTDNFGRPIK